MISRIEALSFRSLRYIEQDVRQFEVLVGPNGAGKSTFLDVLVLLKDVLQVGPTRALLGDAANHVSPRTTNPQDLNWMGQGGGFELAVELPIPKDLVPSHGRFMTARYELGLHTGGPADPTRIAHESLYLLPGPSKSAVVEPTLFPRMAKVIPASLFSKSTPSRWRRVVNLTETGNAYFSGENGSWNNQFKLGPNRSSLANLPEDDTRFPVAVWVRNILLQGIQRVALSAEKLRLASPPGSPTTFMPDGSNLPWVVNGLARDKKKHRKWVEHVRNALPDVRDIVTREREDDKNRYLVVHYKNGLKAPSWLVSDGTLRMLALTILPYIDLENAIYLIEEPENGIHPEAVETVIQALQNVHDAQVLCASHSPVVLSTIRDLDDILCFAKDDLGATDIVLGGEHPILKKWSSETDIGTLFAMGVLGSTRSQVT